MSDEIQTAAEAVEAAAIPRAHAIHLENEALTAEQGNKPEKLTEDLSRKSPAEWAYERLILYIKNFEEQLDNDHEIAMGFAGGDLGVMRIEGMGYYAPDIITFYGTEPNGSRAQLIQHVSQLNVMLRALPKEIDRPEPNRIGFRLAADLEKKEKGATS